MVSCTPAGLSDLSEHVVFETEALFRIARQLDAVTLEGVGHEWEIQIALIEAFTIHARSLIAFLWDNTSRYGDGGLAAHYFEPGEWEGLRPPMERTLDGVRARVASEIAHISYAPNARDRRSARARCADLVSVLMRAAGSYPWLDGSASGSRLGCPRA
jgi:hypothetical protein